MSLYVKLSRTLLAICCLVPLAACEENSGSFIMNGEYTGTGSVTIGVGETSIENLYPRGGRVSPVGVITGLDGTEWTVPADNNYNNAAFPFAPDLYNPDGVQRASSSAALASFDPADIITIDTGGDLITGYIFADNYFELYVNGVPVGKDAIPFTEFNSHIVQFRVSAPYTIAMKLVDWEENLGIGSEANTSYAFHPGDAGVVAVFKNESGAIVAATGADWKAQTFYTAPIYDLSCLSEVGEVRNSSQCSAADQHFGAAFGAVHWPIPADWADASFDDSSWPDATTFTNEEAGVSNKPSFTNFTDIFDDPARDAQIIWSTNLVLDNEVIARYTVQ